MRSDLAPIARFLFAPLDEEGRCERLIAALLVGLLCGFGLWLRLSDLAQYHFSGDDCLHIENARLPTVHDVLSDLWTRDAHPPFYYLILHFFFLWIPLSQPIVPKLLSLIVGGATIPASYFLGRAVTGARAPALLLALLTTISGHLVLQSETVRHYSLLMLLQILHLKAFFTPRQRREAPYFVFAALVVCTHFIAALCVFATGLAGLYEALRNREKTPRILTWLAAHALLGALFLALLLPTQSVLHLRPEGINEYLSKATIRDQGGAFRELVYVLSSVHLSPDGVWPWILLIPTTIGTALAINRRAIALLIVAHLPLALALILSAAGIYPIGQGRWCLWIIPGQLLLLASTVQDIKARFRIRAGCLALFTIIFAISGNLATSGGRSVLHPNIWRRTAQLSHVPPTRDEEAQLWRVLGQLDASRSTLLLPIAQHKRMSLDTQLDWAPPVAMPQLSGCKTFAWDFFTAAQAKQCAHELLRSRNPPDQVWFINLPPQQQQGAFIAEYQAEKCLPIGAPKSVGAFVLVPIDLRALREPPLAQQCGR